MSEITSILKEIRPEHDFSLSKDFIFDGLLDSFDIVILVTSLEEKFGFSIDSEDVLPENFSNLEALEQLVERYLNNEES